MERIQLIFITLIAIVVIGCYRPDSPTQNTTTPPVSSATNYYFTFKVNGVDSTIWDSLPGYNFSTSKNAAFQDFYRTSSVINKRPSSADIRVDIFGKPDSTIPRAEFEGLAGQSLQLTNGMPPNSYNKYSGSIQILNLLGTTITDTNVMPGYYLKIDTVKFIRNFQDPVTTIQNSLYNISGSYNARISGKDVSGKFRMPFSFIQY
jgi:hypothetical protein